MVIDPAGDAPRILSNIRELDLKIGLIVATHTHPDHIGAIGHIAEYTGASFAVHTAEGEIIQRYDFSQFAADGRQLFLPVNDNYFCRFTSFLFCSTALVR